MVRALVACAALLVGAVTGWVQRGLGSRAAPFGSRTTLQMGRASPDRPPSSLGSSSRRGVVGLLGQVAVALSPLLAPSLGSSAAELVDSFYPSSKNPFPPPPRKNNRELAYSVDDTDPPSMLPRTAAGEASAIAKLSTMQVVILGCHLYTPTTLSLYPRSTAAPNAQYSDVALACSLIVRLAKLKPGLVLGLDNVAATAASQQIIDRFMSSPKASADEAVAALKDAGLLYNSLTAAASPSAAGPARVADAEMLRALLDLARDQSLTVSPMALPPAVSKTLLLEGLDGIKSGVGELLPDPTGFVDSVQGEGFSRYVNNVVSVEYGNALAAAGTGTAAASVVSAERFLSNRILLDETLASKAVGTIRQQPLRDAPLVLVTDLSRVRFGYGIVERLKRLLLLPSTATSTPTTMVVASTLPAVASVMLNPTAEDSLSPSNQLRLSLGYGIFLPSSRPLTGRRLFLFLHQHLLLAFAIRSPPHSPTVTTHATPHPTCTDFIWYTSSPPSRVLTRTKNAINKEGDRPDGESSVLGAF